LLAPPPSRREGVVDLLHGHEIPDPYRWLEDGEAPDVAAWVGDQNERTRQALDSRPDRRAWAERVVALLGLPVSTGVRMAGNRVFSLERGGGQKQFRLVVRPANDPDAPARTLVDPAELTDDATAAIDWYHPSWEGRLVAYGISEGGDERSILRVLDVATGGPLGDEIPYTRAASVAWMPDAASFLYTRYPDGDEYNRMVYRHEIGRPATADELVWGDLPNPEAWPEVAVSPDGRYRLVTVEVGWARTDLHLLDATTGVWREVIAGQDAVTRARFDHDRLVAVTTLGSPRGRVVAIPLVEPVEPGGWTTLVAEGPGVVQHAEPTRDGLLVATTERAAARLSWHRTDGSLRHEVGLPELCSVVGLDGEPDQLTAFLQLEGFTRPATLYRWDGGDALHRHGHTDGPAAPKTRFAIHQELYTSDDGTPVGLFLIHAEGNEPSADTPCILTGYGGFAIANTPAWSPMIAAWAGAGGLFAVAGLRGGFEEGEVWHEAGRRGHKQNVFDDFQAAADHLVATRLTARHRLAIRGGSNGGLLVGATLTQRPDLCRAVHCAVPLLDMVRYPRFLIARLWTDEYGDPEVADEFAWLLAYSPYHHVVEGLCYPSVLLTTAEGDSRVDPAHARKMAAALQHASACQDERPILLHQESRAGHGQGKPLHKQADEMADVLSFFSWQLGVDELVTGLHPGRA
jgi:prolyl oligopeptidase